MKKTIIHLMLCLGALLLCGACQKEDTGRDGEGAVKVQLGLGGTRAGIDPSAYPWTQCAIRVYRYGAGEGAARERLLVRRYASVGEMPASLWLAAGDYVISVELGQQPEDARLGLATWDRALPRRARLYDRRRSERRRGGRVPRGQHDRRGGVRQDGYRSVHRGALDQCRPTGEIRPADRKSVV